MQIEGVSHATILSIISEIGPDGFKKFDHSKKFTSWLRLAPNNKISGGKILSNKVPKGSNRLKIALKLKQQRVLKSNKSPLLYLSQNNREQLEKFLDQLQLKAYSASTIRTYKNEFVQLLYLLRSIPVQDLQPQHLQRYLLYCLQHGLHENTVHSRINALKFYYEQVLHKHKMFFEIPRPKKPLQLPKLLNEEELRKLFNALTNKKHKAILFTAYSAGLRVSEIVNLKISHIDSKRMQIFIERSKGKKDRYVNLSPILLDILR
jgi:integrase